MITSGLIVVAILKKIFSIIFQEIYSHSFIYYTISVLLEIVIPKKKEKKCIYKSMTRISRYKVLN